MDKIAISCFLYLAKTRNRYYDIFKSLYFPTSGATQTISNRQKGDIGMAQEFITQEHIGTDGILHLNIDTALQNTDVAVKVVVEPKADEQASSDITNRVQAMEQYFATPFPQIPILSNKAISREAIYGERG